MALYHTPLLTGAAATAAIFNSRFQELDNAIAALAAHEGGLLNQPSFDASGDGVQDDSNALEDALALGGVVQGKPGKVYRITRAIEIVSNTIFDLNGATILQNGIVNSTGFFYAAGSQGSKVNFTSDLVQGSNQIALPTGQGVAGGWAKGDLIIVESNDIDINVSGTDTFCKEMYKVKGVSGDTLTIHGALIHNYTTANSSKYSKATPTKNIYIKNFKATNGNDPTYVGYSLRFDLCENINLQNTHLYDVGGGIPIYDTYGFNVNNLLIENVTDFSGSLVAYGYGIFPGSTACFGEISGYKAHNLRHAFTTIYEQRSGGSLLYGSPRHITVRDGEGTASDTIDSTAIWDTHQAGYDITFKNLRAMGGTPSLTHGFQLRSPTKLIGCIALFCGARGVSASDGSNGSVVEGGEFAYNGLNGVTTRSGFRVLGPHIHHNAAAGLVISGDDIEVKNCRIEENANYGVQYSSGSRPTFHNNYIPYSAAQGVAILNAPATAVIRDNDFGSGYSGSGALFGASSSALVQDNIGYVTENSGTATINSGGTSVTVSHGCHRTPTLDDISIVFGEQGTNDYGRWWISNITSTQFTINVASDPGASNLDLAWRVRIL